MSELSIKIDIAEQKLILMKQDVVLKIYRIASAKNGVGERKGSECTPRGWHIIRAKIGQGCEKDTIFVGRREKGIFSAQMEQQFPEKDWILSRIMWLSGLELGKNRLGEFDTMQRYIYIHGCPNSHPMGIPSSHGCIKMHNEDVIDLFERVSAGTKVFIA